MSSLGTMVLVILITVAAIAAVIMALAAVVLLTVILFRRQLERALTPDLWQGYDDGGG